MVLTINSFIISQHGGGFQFQRPAWNGIKQQAKLGFLRLQPRQNDISQQGEGLGRDREERGGLGRHLLVQRILPPSWGGGRRRPPACGFGRTSRRLWSATLPPGPAASAHRATTSPAWNAEKSHIVWRLGLIPTERISWRQDTLVVPINATQKNTKHFFLLFPSTLLLHPNANKDNDKYIKDKTLSRHSIYNSTYHERFEVVKKK